MVTLIEFDGLNLKETTVDTPQMLAVRFQIGNATYEVTQADPAGGLTITANGKPGERLHIRPNSGNTITLLVKPE